MNWEAIGAVGEWIGGVAVLATLLYLAIQIKQNTKQLKSNSLDTMAHRMDSVLHTEATDVQLAKLMDKIAGGTGSITSAEYIRLRAWIGIWVHDLEEVYRQSKVVPIPESALLNRLANLQDKLSTEEAMKAWVALRPLTDPEFVAWAEAKLNLDIPPLASTS